MTVVLKAGVFRYLFKCLDFLNEKDKRVFERNGDERLY